MENLHRDLSKEREEKSKSRDLSNRSLKTVRKMDSGEPTWGSLERERGEESSEQQVSEDRWGDRERRI